MARAVNWSCSVITRTQASKYASIMRAQVMYMSSTAGAPGPPRRGDLPLRATRPATDMVRLVDLAEFQGKTSYRLQGESLGGTFTIQGDLPARQKDKSEEPVGRGRLEVRDGHVFARDTVRSHTSLQRLAYFAFVPVSLCTVEGSKPGFQCVSRRGDRYGCVGYQGSKAECGHLAAAVIERQLLHPKSPSGPLFVRS